MVNKNDLDMTRIESPWSLSGTNTLIFFTFNGSVGFSNCLTLDNIHEPCKSRDSPIFEWTDNRWTDGRTDRQTEPIA